MLNEIKGLFNTIAEKMISVFDAGKKAEYDRFWDGYQPEKGATVSHDRRFAGGGWTNETWTPKYSMNVWSAQYMFWASPVTDVQEYLDKAGVVLNFEPCSNFTQTFSYCSLKWLRKFGTSSKTATYNGTFSNATNLHTIEEFYVTPNSTFTSSVFDGATALVNLNIIGTIGKSGFNVGWSTKLDKESIMSIINALSTTTSGLTVTLSKTAVNNAFGINVDDPTTYPEGSEWYELKNSRSNWTIAYRG